MHGSFLSNKPVLFLKQTPRMPQCINMLIHCFCVYPAGLFQCAQACLSDCVLRIGYELCCCGKQLHGDHALDIENHWSLQAASTQLEGLRAEIAELKTNRQQAEHSLAAMQTRNTVAADALKDVRKQRQQAGVDLKGEKKKRQGAEEALRSEQNKGDQLATVSYQNSSTVLVGYRPCCLIFVLKLA